MGSWFDLVLVGVLVGSIALGMHEGLLRQGFLLLAMYVGTVLSAQYYSHLSGLILRIFPNGNPDVAGVVAFIILVGIFTAIVTWLIWSGYRETKLPTMMLVDNMGGATLGAVFGLFAIAITIMIANYALAAPWPEGSSIKFALRIGLGNSALQDILSVPVPIFQSALRPWIPANIPFML